MNVTAGTVHPQIITGNNSATFIEFCTELATTVEPGRSLGCRPQALTLPPVDGEAEDG